MTTNRNAGEDPLRTLDELDGLISNARSMPMNTSAIVNRENTLHLIDRARNAAPSAVRRTEKIATDADVAPVEGRAEPGRLVQYTQEESERLVAGENIARMADDQADSITAVAEDKAASLRHGADKYSDRTLTSLEAKVTKVTEQIRIGCEVLAGRLGDGAGQPVEIQEPVCRRLGWSVDPSTH